MEFLNNNDNSTQVSAAQPQYNWPNGICNDNIYANTMNTQWLVTTAGLMILLQLGMSLFEAGSVRRKNSAVVFFRYLIMNLFGTLAFWIVGYAFAWADSFDNFMGGKDYYASDNMGECNRFANVPTQFAFWCWHYVVGLLSLNIIIQMISERVTLKATAAISAVYMGWIYPICVAWTWAQGWMFHEGYTDYAGTGIWAVPGAMAGLAALLVIGTRFNRWNKFEDVYDERMMDSEMRGARSIPVDRIGEGEGPLYSSLNRAPGDLGRQVTFLNLARIRQRAFDEENDNFGVGNLPFLMMGGLIIWFGLYFLSVGATWGLIKSNTEYGSLVENAAIGIFLGGCAGGLVTMLIRKPLMHGMTSPYRMRFSAAGAMRGFIAGIIATMAGSPQYRPWASFVAGAFGGLFYVLVAKLFDAIKLDDPSESFAVFWGGGAVGSMVLSFLNITLGILYDNPTDGKIFGLQLMGMVVNGVWAFVCMLIFCFILKLVHAYRVDVRTEVVGYDYIEFADEIDFTGKKLTIKKVEPDVGKKA
jgi:ammonia channel protein AmtB